MSDEVEFVPDYSNSTYLPSGRFCNAAGQWLFLNPGVRWMQFAQLSLWIPACFICYSLSLKLFFCPYRTVRGFNADNLTWCASSRAFLVVWGLCCAKGEPYTNLGCGCRKNKSVANPLAEKVQNIKRPNCRNTSNTNNLIYILKTKICFCRLLDWCPMND